MDFEQKFTALFKSISPHYRRSEVFYDFITILGLEFYLVLYGEQADETLKQRYQIAVAHYTEDEKQKLVELSVIIVEALENKAYDFLGSVFMGLELGDRYKAQHFTPSYVAQAMVTMTLSNCHDLIQQRGFILLQEPTCGSGVMIIEAYNYLRRESFNPQQQMWVQARDLDFTAAMMCYIQMTLLHIPGEVIIGNTLTNEVNYHLYTLAHILGNWNKKLEDVDSYTEAEYQVIESEPVEEIPLEIDWENEPMFY
ncbi:TPA: SAM-dependent DNA methyltransferase [Pasteurella multocida]|nr:SAM-dependent DNA methyltransferase [Pasteurella multocida]HDR1793945.1 SAM-dependent DNA methyltransferase [Pasteurella multocida]HDR1868203.1 SAM-dependent DNA methyltransferase [Pasteurella multocida]HED4417510.1 SAM-dependent DNA methyltransferase [Pasteurella multocida]HED4466710.1 SAM-dependent DNA methyltransferase [Pasteurella multocida]